MEGKATRAFMFAPTLLASALAIAQAGSCASAVVTYTELHIAACRADNIDLRSSVRAALQ